MSEKAMVLCSGGVDSTTCLALAVEKYGRENVSALSIYYGQKHVREIEAAKKVLEYYGVEGTSLDLTPVFAYSDCSLLSHSTEDIPEESYAEQLAQRGGKILESYSLFDIYEGTQIKEGYKSIAYTLTFRAKDKTLEDVEITAAMKKILNGLEQLGIELRQ